MLKTQNLYDDTHKLLDACASASHEYIDPKYRSGLHTIQLLCVIEAQILQKYSIHEILEPFMSDIKQLESVRKCFLYISTCTCILNLNYA